MPTTPSDRHTNVCVRSSSELCGAGRNDMMIVGMNVIPNAAMGLLGVWVNECRSEGTLSLASADPSIDPVVEERMLDHESDRIRMRDGIRRLLDLAAADPIIALSIAALAAVQPLPLPHGGAPSDHDLDAWMLRVATDAQHICAMARMGTGDDSVVDTSCRVHGVGRLRVVDASVFPRVPPGQHPSRRSGRRRARRRRAARSARRQSCRLLISRNSSRPWAPYSRPMPDCL